jgi:hypothetical protein
LKKKIGSSNINFQTSSPTKSTADSMGFNRFNCKNTESNMITYTANTNINSPRLSMNQVSVSREPLGNSINLYRKEALNYPENLQQR